MDSSWALTSAGATAGAGGRRRTRLQQVAIGIGDGQRPHRRAREVGHKDVLAEGSVAVHQWAPLLAVGLLQESGRGSVERECATKWLDPATWKSSLACYKALKAPCWPVAVSDRVAFGWWW